MLLQKITPCVDFVLQKRPVTWCDDVLTPPQVLHQEAVKAMRSLCAAHHRCNRMFHPGNGARLRAFLASKKDARPKGNLAALSRSQDLRPASFLTFQNVQTVQFGNPAEGVSAAKHRPFSGRPPRRQVGETRRHGAAPYMREVYIRVRLSQTPGAMGIRRLCIYTRHPMSERTAGERH